MLNVTPDDFETKGFLESEPQLSTLIQVIPKHLVQINSVKSWGFFALYFGGWLAAHFMMGQLPFSLGWSLLWTVPLQLALWITCVFFMAGLFVMGHDCGHYALFRSRRANLWIGHLSLAISFTGFHIWRIIHNQHHIYSNLLKEDTTWAQDRKTVSEYMQMTANEKKEYLLGFATPWGVLLGYWFVIFRYLRFQKYWPQVRWTEQNKKQVIASNLFVWSFFAVWGGLWIQQNGTWGLFQHVLIPFAFGAPLATVIPLFQHTSVDLPFYEKGTWTPFRGQVLATLNWKIPRPLEWALCDVNHHLAHHLSPKVPWYHLKEANLILKQTFPQYFFEKTLSLGSLKEIWDHPVLAWDADSQSYRSVSLSEISSSFSSH